MVGHIAPPVYHHHVCNIDGIDNCYCLDNCLVHDCDLCNYNHQGHIHLHLYNYYNNCYCNSLHGKCCIVCSYSGIGPYNCFVVPLSLLRSSEGPSAALLTPIWSVASAITSLILIMIIIVYLFIGLLFFWGEGAG